MPANEATRRWDGEIKQAANWLRRESGAACVVVLLVDPPHMDPDPDTGAIQSGIAGTSRVKPERLAHDLRMLADEIELHGEKIHNREPFEVDRTRGGEPS